MHKSIVVFFASCFALCWSVGGLAYAQESRDPRQMGADTKSVRIARFHSAWFFTGFTKGDLEGNQATLAVLLNSFNRQFAQKFPEVPALLKVTPKPIADIQIVKPSITWGDVEAKLDAVSKDIREDDVVFCYIMAHGESKDDQVSLSFGADRVARSTIVDRLKKIKAQRKARLVVFVTDNCSGEARGGEIARMQIAPAGIWRALYFGHEGFLDLASTKKGQLGFVVNGVSVFNEAFSRALNLRTFPATRSLFDAGNEREAEQLFVRLLDANHDGIVSWDEFLVVLNNQMTEVFDEGLSKLKDVDVNAYNRMKAQGGQQATILEYPGIRRAE